MKKKDEKKDEKKGKKKLNLHRETLHALEEGRLLEAVVGGFVGTFRPTGCQLC